VNCSWAWWATTYLATLPPDRRLSNMVDKIASSALLPWMADWLLNGCWWIELVDWLMIKLLNVFKIFICNVEWIFFFAFPLILREALIHWWIRFQRLWIMQLFNAILVANRHWFWCECVAPLLGQLSYYLRCLSEILNFFPCIIKIFISILFAVIIHCSIKPFFLSGFGWRNRFFISAFYHDDLLRLSVAAALISKIIPPNLKCVSKPAILAFLLTDSLSMHWISLFIWCILNLSKFALFKISSTIC